MYLFSALRKMKILLIDDDEWIRGSLQLFFEAEGCKLIALETAEEGLAALREDTYDIIIVDYKLPGQDGIEFLKQIRNTHSDAIKILITAYKSEPVVSEAKKLDIQGFIENRIAFSQPLGDTVGLAVGAPVGGRVGLAVGGAHALAGVVLRRRSVAPRPGGLEGDGQVLGEDRGGDHGDEGSGRQGPTQALHGQSSSIKGFNGPAG